MKSLVLVLLTALVCAASAFAAESKPAPQFTDIPKGHWAAESIELIARDGIMKGFPDGTFRGEAPVTRYELAVTLLRFVEFVQQSKKPLVESGSAPKVAVSPKPPKWAAVAVENLVGGGYISRQSPIVTDGSKPVSSDDLAKALASVAARIVELDTPDAGPDGQQPNLDEKAPSH